MTSFSSSPSLTIPTRFRRKSSSASTSYSIDNYGYGLGEHTPSSPPLSSSPLLTPLHHARPYDYVEWRTSDYPDDLRGEICSQDDIYHPWSRHTLHMRRALPSLMTKSASSTLWGDTPLPYSPSCVSPTPQTAYLYPRGDSAISDDCEEHDLESMNIHIRETYFATSAERGRWLSSPIALRVHSRATPPTHAYSSPIRSPTNISLLGEQIPTVQPEEHDEDMRCSSTLPPSSPLSSPLSHLSFLGDDCEDNAIVDPCSNPDDSNPFGATPELSTACTSPTESPRTLIPHKAPIIDSLLPLSHSYSHLSDSPMPRHSSPGHNHSPKPVRADAHAPNTSSLEWDGALSPLSQFELNLREPEPLKLPLSDMENKFYPGQHMVAPGVEVDTIRSRNGSPPVQFPSMRSNDEVLDVSHRTLRANSKKNAKKGKGNATGNPREAKKRTAIRPESPYSDEKGRGVENHTTDDLEPPRKKSKVSRCRDDYRGKPQRKRDGIPKTERRQWSPSLPAVERCGSSSEQPSRGDETSKIAAEPVPGDAANAEFHGSLTGMLIEAFATSRATSMDPSALYIALTQAHPCLAAERPKQDLLMDIVGVLEAGRVRCGMFEKVDCSRERTRHKGLEGRWFYVPERDEDSERASLISAIMPRQKRNETKKYKQYYYRPLDKISRWDPEDAP